MTEPLTTDEAARLEWLLADLWRLGAELRPIAASPRALLDAAETLHASLASPVRPPDT